jgi:hypothetical protein
MRGQKNISPYLWAVVAMLTLATTGFANAQTQAIPEERETRRAAVLHTVFLSHPRSLVRGSGRSEECAPQHGLRRRPLRFAVNFRHPAARVLPQLKICRTLSESRTSCQELFLRSVRK